VTAFGSVTGEVWNSASTSRAEIPISRWRSTFLYHCVSDPCTGKSHEVLRGTRSWAVSMPNLKAMKEYNPNYSWQKPEEQQEETAGQQKTQ